MVSSVGATENVGQLRFCLLGEFQAWRGGDLLPPNAWRTRQTLTTLKLLLQERGRLVPFDRLVDAIWPEGDPESARNSLQAAIRTIRRVLEPHLSSGAASSYVRTDGAGYRFLATGCAIDVDAFAEARRRGRAAAATQATVEAIEAYERALAVYRGDYLLDDPYAEWAGASREELHSDWLETLEALATLLAAAGRYDDAIAHLERALRADPLREELYRQLLRCHAAAGRRARALSVYERCRRTLDAELGVTPDTATEQLYRAIVSGGALPGAEQGAHLAAAASPPQPAPPSTPPKHNLPFAVTSFVGRAHELAAVRDCLAESRLVTLTGPGGCGKTRMALEIAHALAGACRGGVWLVELAPLRDPALLLSAVAAAMGVHASAGESREEAVAERVRRGPCLLVLDNCEHQRAACAALAATLLRMSPQLRILATSRAALRVLGELVWYVRPLTLPPDGEEMAPAASVEPGDALAYEAVELFVARARFADPGFALTRANTPAVVQLCRRLDALPLALELAAARIRALAPAQILARLDQRFTILTAGNDGGPSRHRTLEAAIDWSYHLLDDRERRVFQRLARFSGGWTLEAAEVVCTGGAVEPPDVLDALAALVDKSLVVAETGSSGAVRYRLLDTLHRYAALRLTAAGDREATERRHARYYAALAESMVEKLTLPEQARWLAELEREHDNLRAALGWSAAQASEPDAGVGVQLAGALWKFWEVRGHLEEGARWFETILARKPAAAPATLARAHYGAGSLARQLGEYDRAASYMQACVALYRQAGDEVGLARALNGLGVVARDGGHFEPAAAYFAESLARYESLGDAWGAAAVTLNLGVLARATEDLDRAETLCAEALRCFECVGDRRCIALALHNLGLAAWRRGDLARASALCAESLPLFAEIGDKRGIAQCLEGLAGVAGRTGQPVRAARLLGAAETVRETIHTRPSRTEQFETERVAQALAQDGDANAIAAAREAGRAMCERDAIAAALDGVPPVELVTPAAAPFPESAVQPDFSAAR